LRCTEEKLNENYERLLEIYKYKLEQVSLSESPLCNYNGLNSALNSGDINRIVEANKALSNLGCEVVF
jgi:hypothetical protein